MPATGDDRTRVVIVGAGFGGLTAARHLARDADAPIEITLVDRHNYHTFQPLLYQVATAGLAPQDVAHNVRNVFARALFGRLRRRVPVRVRMGTVVDVDLDGRELSFSDGTALAYDVLILAVGASTNDYGIPGVLDHGFPLKSLSDAATLRNHILGQFERANSDPDLIEDGALTFVISGAGPTGVELAGALTELIDVVARDYPDLPIDRAQVILVEMMDDVLPPYRPRMRRYTRAALEDRGVDVRTGTAIERVRHDRVELADGSSIRTRSLIWTAGVKANPLASILDVEQAEGGRIVVEPDLRLPERPGVFVVGDIAAARGRGGEPLPQLAPVAIQQGRHVAEQVRRHLAGRSTEPFRYVDKGNMATIGRHDAVVELPFGIAFGGVLAWLSWLGLHLLFLVGFRNRAAVFLSWMWNYLTYDRAARLIVEPREPQEDEIIEGRPTRRSA